MEESDQTRGLPQPPLEIEPQAGWKIIPLPVPNRLELGHVDLRRALEDRRSVRTYSEQPFTLAELSWLLWSCQGVKAVSNRPVTLRTVPSAGARHAFETYLLVNNVTGLEPGLYKFLAIDHTLAAVNLKAGIADRVADACYQQQFVKTCAVTFIFTAAAYRMYWRYGARGYRYLFLDAGHVSQNLYLAAEAFGGGACAIGAFYDDEINRILDLDGQEQFVIYVTTTGKKP
ncbi:MAG: SagB/ThcOx family dehydrogenase [Candidatus Bathyarchaeota archaeon]|nr:MAG: SagB/ThcOx family dehydrogenase [Candidatus Bathyarchaeota archaeon]